MNDIERTGRLGERGDFHSSRKGVEKNMLLKSGKDKKGREGNNNRAFLIRRGS